MANYSCPTCDPCVTGSLPNYQIPCAPDIVSSEISNFIIGKQDPSNPGQVTGGSIDMTSDTAIGTAESGGHILILEVVGDKPAPDVTTVVGTKFREYTVTRKHVVNVTIMDNNLDTHTLLRWLECDPIIQGWWANMGGYVYGGGHGVTGQVRNAHEVLDRGEGSAAAINFEFHFSSKCSPVKEVYGLRDGDATAHT